MDDKDSLMRNISNKSIELNTLIQQLIELNILTEVLHTTRFQNGISSNISIKFTKI